MKARILIISTLAILVVIFASLFKTLGYEETYQLFCVPTMSPHFLDLRTITHGSESYAQGLDTMKENPTDPLQRTLNYPRIWQCIYYFGLNRSHTTAFGVVLIACFLGGIILILPNPSPLLLFMMIAAIISPATLLAFERGNIDLLMFGIVATAIVCVQRRVVCTVLLLMLGCLLKIFPIFGAIILVRLRPKICIMSGLILVVFTSIFLLSTIDDLRLIRAGTPTGTGASFGKDVFWMRAAELNPDIGSVFKVLTTLVILGVGGFASWLLLKLPAQAEKQPNSLAMDCFRAGATIYVCAFLLGNNYDYRLIFLIFAIPQLLIWVKSWGTLKGYLATLTLSTVYLSMWGFVIRGICCTFPQGKEVAYLFDECFNWGIWIGCVMLLSTSMPMWIPIMVRSLVSLNKNQQVTVDMNAPQLQ